MQEFDEWLDSGTILTFTEDGPEFRVEPPSALTVLTLRRRLADGAALNDAIEHEFIVQILGATWEALREAGVAEIAAIHAGRAVLTRYLASADAALKLWRFEPDDDQPKPEEKRGPSIYGVDPDDSIDPPGTINDYDPGGGPYIPDKGIRVWAYPMEYAPAFQQQQAEQERERAEWPDIFDAWEAVEIDFAHLFHVTISPDLLAAMPWRTFGIRLSRILGDPSTFTSRIIEARKAEAS